MLWLAWRQRRMNQGRGAHVYGRANVVGQAAVHGRREEAEVPHSHQRSQRDPYLQRGLSE